MINFTQNLQGMKLLYACFSFAFSSFFSILIHFKTDNLGKLQGVYSNSGEYIEMMTMKFSHCPLDLLQARKAWKQTEMGEWIVRI